MLAGKTNKKLFVCGEMSMETMGTQIPELTRRRGRQWQVVRRVKAVALLDSFLETRGQPFRKWNDRGAGQSQSQSQTPNYPNPNPNLHSTPSNMQ